jgi:hypothetical protein
MRHSSWKCKIERKLLAILLEHPEKYEYFNNGITLKLFTSNEIRKLELQNPNFLTLLARPNP